MAQTLISSALISKRVRIQTHSISFAEPFDDIIVEVYDAGQWQRARSFNRISNDHAWSAAYEYATSLDAQKELA